MCETEKMHLYNKEAKEILYPPVCAQTERMHFCRAETMETRKLLECVRGRKGVFVQRRVEGVQAAIRWEVAGSECVRRCACVHAGTRGWVYV